MVKKIIAIILAATFVLSFSTPEISFAQMNEEKAELTGTRKQLATIIFSGLAGAILGLSTLSFYGRPQEHLSNIAVGFAVGVIGGTIHTTYKAATRPYEAYDLGVNDPEHKRLTGMDVFAIHNEAPTYDKATQVQLFEYQF